MSSVSGVQRIFASIACDLAWVLSTGVPYSPATVMFIMSKIVSARGRLPAQMFSVLANSASRLTVSVVVHSLCIFSSIIIFWLFVVFYSDSFYSVSFALVDDVGVDLGCADIGVGEEV